VIAAKTTTAYIGLGSNLQNPPEQIRMAMRAISKIPQTRIVTDSGLFLSKPLVPPSGPVAQPDYYNAVVKIETGLGPYELLDHLQQIEYAQQRERGQHWGPRTIDLDILMFDNMQTKDERLTLPHPGLPQREFVLYPLRNIDPALTIPGHGMLNDLITRCPDKGLQYLGTIEGYRE
jgi:2-amino-4-hydroxy-6-hydroxymethyldihydropteridine diphosphokinase